MRIDELEVLDSALRRVSSHFCKIRPAYLEPSPLMEKVDEAIKVAIKVINEENARQAAMQGLADALNAMLDMDADGDYSLEDWGTTRDIAVAALEKAKPFLKEKP